MLEFSNYRTRLIDLNDLDFLNILRLSKHVQDNVGTHLFTNNMLQKDWIEKISKSSKEKYLILETVVDSNLVKIGLIRLTEIDFINRSVCVGGDILEEFSGKGHGKKMYEIILKICLEIWGMNRLWLAVLEDNVRALNLYKKVGFTEEGRMRQAIFKNGNFKDYIMMSLIKTQ